jgi:hypothetical protein
MPMIEIRSSQQLLGNFRANTRPRPCGIDYRIALQQIRGDPVDVREILNGEYGIEYYRRDYRRKDEAGRRDGR